MVDKVYNCYQYPPNILSVAPSNPISPPPLILSNADVFCACRVTICSMLSIQIILTLFYYYFCSAGDPALVSARVKKTLSCWTTPKAIHSGHFCLREGERDRREGKEEGERDREGVLSGRTWCSGQKTTFRGQFFPFTVGLEDWTQVGKPVWQVPSPPESSQQAGNKILFPFFLVFCCCYFVFGYAEMGSWR